jgi:hypothetical protein
MRVATRAATAAISSQQGARSSCKVTPASPARGKTPSGTTTWKCTKLPSMPLKRWTNVTAPVSLSSMPRLFAVCFCQRAISLIRTRSIRLACAG